jgi:DNA-binding transcriptional MerR regulator
LVLPKSGILPYTPREEAASALFTSSPMPISRRKSKPAAPEIPDKLYFRIGEVARLCGVATYVLRFWESEFPQLRPGKSGTGQRLYRRREVEAALHIRSLLYDQGYTIAGARQILASSRGSHVGSAPANTEVVTTGGLKPTADDSLVNDLPKLGWVRSELREILSLLSEDAPQPSSDDLHPGPENPRDPHQS